MKVHTQERIQICSHERWTLYDLVHSHYTDHRYVEPCLGTRLNYRSIRDGWGDRIWYCPFICPFWRLGIWWHQVLGGTGYVSMVVLLTVISWDKGDCREVTENQWGGLDGASEVPAAAGEISCSLQTTFRSALQESVYYSTSTETWRGFFQE